VSLYHHLWDDIDVIICEILWVLGDRKTCGNVRVKMGVMLGKDRSDVGED
jgi:hypothetical protein